MVVARIRPFRPVELPLETAFWHYGAFILTVYTAGRPWPTHWVVTRRRTLRRVVAVGVLPDGRALTREADVLMMRELMCERLEE